MDVIFGNSLGNPSQYSDDTEYTALIRAKIQDAVDFEQTYLANAREENQNYFYGHLPAPVTVGDDGERVNRSSIVSTDVRDTIMTIMPSLIRMFCSTEDVVVYEPANEQGQEMADDATQYANYVFWHENNGFLKLHSLFKDALTVKSGVCEVYTDTDHEVTENTFMNVSESQFQTLIYEMPEVEVVEVRNNPDGSYAEVTLRHTVSKPKHKVKLIPPEQFRIDRNARDLEKPGLIGYEEVVPISDLVKKGLDPDWLLDFISTASYFSEERIIRNPGLAETDRIDDGVLFGQYYIRIDGDGDGIDELRYVCTIGSGYEIVNDVIVPDHQFAMFCPDPRPHTVIGDAVADLTKDIQEIKTNMMRANLDNLAESNNPKTVINELLTNVEDALNDEVGAVIRTRGDPATAVAFAKIPYNGADIMQGVEYMDKVRASRTGVTEASKGLDPKAMQSTALVGIDAIVSGAQERIELIGRILAETGFKRMFTLLLREFVNKPNREVSFKLKGKWSTVNPSLFDPAMTVTANPTLGKGSDMVRLQALQEVKNTQTLIIEKFGVNNPIVSPIEYRNTLEDILAIANIKNSQRYFKVVTPQILQQIASTPQEPDPASVLAKAEVEKVKAGTVKAIAEKDTKIAGMKLLENKQRMDDDFNRDKLAVTSWVDLIHEHAESQRSMTEMMNTRADDHGA